MSRSTNMNTVRNILRQVELGITSMRKIGTICGCSKNTASNIITVAKSKGITYASAKTMKDDELKAIFYPNNNPYREIPEPDLEYIDKELKHKHVTMKTLHEEYLFANPHGLRYTQFCERYRSYIKSRKITMHIEKKAGEKLEIDWAGPTINIIDPETGEILKASLLVTTLGRSGYPYVEAFLTKELPNFITGVVNSLTYYGGVPACLVPDNDKSAVTKAHKYDPTINKTFQELADYYSVSILPARVRAPQDKSSVEKAVLDLVEREIIGKSRHEKFYSLHELNSYIKRMMKSFSNKKFQKKDGSRLSVFLQEDFPCLKPLPAVPYEFTLFRVATVNVDYHVSFEHNLYSVPFRFVRQRVELRVKRYTIEIIHNNERIAIHERVYNKRNHYSTKVEHMPAKHQFYHGLSKEYFESWAQQVDPKVHEVVKSIFNGRHVEQHGYRACLGLQALFKKYPDHFIKACEMACEYDAKSFKYINQFTKQLASSPSEDSTYEEESIIKHDNIRGLSYYQTSLANYSEEAN